MMLKMSICYSIQALSLILYIICCSNSKCSNKTHNYTHVTLIQVLHEVKCDQILCVHKPYFLMPGNIYWSNGSLFLWVTWSLGEAQKSGLIGFVIPSNTAVTNSIIRIARIYCEAFNFVNFMTW